MKLTFFGAAHAVTGSCHCLEVNGKKILIDCGLQQGRDEHDENALDFAPSYIDYVIVTHAHIDHSGRIPLLVKEGFQGQIFATRLTCQLMSVMLRDSAFIQESDAEWQNQKGKRAGIVGCGRIGQTTGRIAKALGMKVLAYDLYPNDSGKAIAEYVDLDTLLAQSDVVFLHCNLTADNEKMINKASIAKMKDGAILINNSRGQLIDEQDVTDALKAGKLAAAGLDVVYTEPIRADNPLLTAPNCIITPHMSWGAKEARQRIMDCTADNIRAYLDGEPIHVVNP